MLASVDLAELDTLQHEERWDAISVVLRVAALGLERAGVDFLLMCTTTYHRVAEQVQAAVSIPLLHLADVVAEACTEARLDTVAFLGTGFAMERHFFTNRLSRQALVVHVPDRRHHAMIDSVIYDELVGGKVLDDSRRKILAVIDELWDAGSCGVILGCTELEQLVRQADCEIPVFGRTTLHVEAALARALA